MIQPTAGVRCVNPYSILKKNNMFIEKKYQKRWYPLNPFLLFLPLKPEEQESAAPKCSFPVVERQISLQFELENLARSKPWALFLDAFFEANKRGHPMMAWGLYTQIWSAT